MMRILRQNYPLLRVMKTLKQTPRRSVVLNPRGRSSLVTVRNTATRMRNWWRNMQRKIIPNLDITKPSTVLQSPNAFLVLLYSNRNCLNEYQSHWTFGDLIMTLKAGSNFYERFCS